MGVGAWELDWSPDGTQLVGAFPSCADPDLACEPDIYVFGTDGGGLTNLTNTDGPEYNPSWSPDGDTIAFDSPRAGESDIYTIDADGGGELNITTDLSSPATEPDWAPDSSKLAFEVDLPFYAVSVWTAHPDGSDKEQLLTAPSGAFQPAWSPDGEQLALPIRSSAAATRRPFASPAPTRLLRAGLRGERPRARLAGAPARPVAPGPQRRGIRAAGECVGGARAAGAGLQGVPHDFGRGPLPARTPAFVSVLRAELLRASSDLGGHAGRERQARNRVRVRPVPGRRRRPQHA